MTETANKPVNPADFEAAVTRLRRARQMQIALEPLRLLLADVDEELRQAAMKADDAGMSQRAIAAQAGVAQPSVKGMLDGRRGAPTPPPSLSEQAWALHHSASALETMLRRLLGQGLPTETPGDRHVIPQVTVGNAAAKLNDVVKDLAAAAASTETYARKRRILYSRP